MLRGKYIDLNNFNCDILSDAAIKEYRLEYEESEDGKIELDDPKYLSLRKVDTMGT